MAIIHNGQQLPADYDILLEKWKCKSVSGEVEPDKPSFCVFNNTRLALDMLRKHIDNNSKIVFHTDIDVDGIGTTYIFKKTLENLGSNNHILLINKDKVHGIMRKHVEYFKKRPVDLVIITDSSSNEIEIIKQFESDVLVIDHHELLNNNLSGKCNDGIHDYIILNNTIDNKNQELDNLWLRSKNISAFKNLVDYKGTPDMSCGLVVYELLRLYCECFANPNLLENLMLYQWVGITLLTDVIDNLNDRNQWYMNKTVFNKDVESTLRVILTNINKFKATIDKSYITYSFAPIINKTIRAGESAIALHTVINNPNNITELNKYAEMQKEAVDKATIIKIQDPLTGAITACNRVFNQENIIMDISKLNISPNYCGVIASRLSGDNNKNAAVFVLDTSDGLYKGSFRGKYKDVDYRKYFDAFADDIYAQGHKGAFGFKVTKEQLDSLIGNIKSIEPLEDTKPWLTLGNMKPDEYGKYHISSLDDFKRLGYIWRIATGNSKVTSKDEIVIRVKSNDVVLKDTKGKLFIYDVLGLECKAFKPLSGEYFDVYIEYTNEINMYIR